MAEETEINAKELPASEEEPQSKVRLVIGIIIAVLLLAGLHCGFDFSLASLKLQQP